MLGKIGTALKETLPSGSRLLPVPESLADDDRSTRAESRLYECPACHTVYIATAPHQCGTCQTTVEPVEES